MPKYVKRTRPICSQKPQKKVDKATFNFIWNSFQANSEHDQEPQLGLFDEIALWFRPVDVDASEYLEAFRLVYNTNTSLGYGDYEEKSRRDEGCMRMFSFLRDSEGYKSEIFRLFEWLVVQSQRPAIVRNRQ